MTCINCQTSLKLYFIKKGFYINRCPTCGLMVVENVPQDLAQYYAKGYFTGDVTLDGYMNYDVDKEVSKKTYIKFLQVLDGYMQDARSKTMLEVGCATGFFMNLAKDRGWEVEGIDISEYAIQKAQAKGLNASVGTIENYNSQKEFQAIVMQDVIEHVKDPIREIKKCRDLLMSGGLLVVTTPDAGSIWAKFFGKHWHAFVPPQHLFYFSAKNLASILEQNGFKVIYSGHHGKWFTLPYIVRLLYSWTTLNIFSKLATRINDSILKEVSVPINVGDTLFLIAKKV